MGKSKVLDLEFHLSFFKAYHTHPINKTIHIYTVWPMFFGFLIFFNFVPPISYHFSSGLALNFSFVFAIGHALFFICLDKKAGFLAAICCVACWFGASAVANQLDFSLAWKVFTASEILLFGMQSVAHAVWEKRAPSDNIVLAILVSPFCVFLEVLKSMFGYEPYPGFDASTEAKMEGEIKKWQAKQEKKVT